VDDEFPDASLAAWAERLWDAEADLREREQRALAASDTSPAEARALAAERDTIAADRDALAAAYDDRAGARDTGSLSRDATASGRDRDARAVADDTDPGFVDRFLSGQDRDWAAGDRASSYDDRRRSAQDRQRAAADRERAATDRQAAADAAAALEGDVAHLREALVARLVIGQAEGLLMARYDLPSPDAAFGVLVRLSQHNHVKLREVAARIVADATTQASEA
jgi:ANTAR domain